MEQTQTYQTPKISSLNHFAFSLNNLPFSPLVSVTRSKGNTGSFVFSEFLKFGPVSKSFYHFQKTSPKIGSEGIKEKDKVALCCISSI